MPSMSSLQPPSATVYPGPYNTVPLQTNIRPNAPIVPNNEVYIPLQFDWTALIITNEPSLTTLCFLVNVGLAPGSIDFIRCLVIDNSYNDYDIHVQFLDGFTITVPAWEPLDVYPVITNQKAFYVWCEQPSNTMSLPLGVTIPQRHLTTNIFVCNANVPPIRAKILDKQVFGTQLITATGITTLTLGTPNLSPNIINFMVSQGVLKAIILNNLSTMGATGAVGIAITIDNIPFSQVAFFANTSFGQDNGSAPIVIPDLNIRGGNVQFNVTASAVSALAVSATVVYTDRSGTSGLT